MKPVLYIVEDEKDLVDLLVYNLEKEGYRALFSLDGEDALKKIPKKKPQLVLLDWMLPKVDGLVVCRTLKANPNTSSIPILMLTARGEENDKVKGLETGADDYLAKPFGMRELLARIRALLRRAGGVKEAAAREVFGELVLDREKHEVLLQNQRMVLTAKEYELLDCLLSQRGKVLSRDMLLNSVWGYDYFGTTRTVDVHVRRLREKLGEASQWIETVKGYGYRWRETP